MDKEKYLEQLVKSLDKSFVSMPHLMWRSFMSGIFSALGATVGLAIVLFIVGYVLNVLGGLPLIGIWISELNQFIK